MSQSNKNKKSNPVGGLLPLLVFLMIYFRSIARNGVPSGGFGLLVPIVVFMILLSAVKAILAYRKKKTDARGQSGPAPSASSAKPAARLHSDFPQPEAHCVVCENTGDDHFAHDREQRIKQLDEWLKNGLIDRKEYQVLKARFERDQ